MKKHGFMLIVILTILVTQTGVYIHSNSAIASDIETNIIELSSSLYDRFDYYGLISSYCSLHSGVQIIAVPDNSSSDIISIMTYQGLQEMISNDEISAISHPIINEEFLCYPSIIQNEIGRSGVPYGIPVQFGINMWVYDIELWDCLALGDLPYTFNDLMIQYNKWNTDYANTYPEREFLSSSNGQTYNLLVSATNQYVLEKVIQGSPIIFSTTEYYELLNLIYQYKQNDENLASRQPIIQMGYFLYPFDITLIDFTDFIHYTMYLRNDADINYKPFYPARINPDFDSKLNAYMEVLAIPKDIENKVCVEDFLAFVQQNQHAFQADLPEMLNPYSIKYNDYMFIDNNKVLLKEYIINEYINAVSDVVFLNDILGIHNDIDQYIGTELLSLIYLYIDKAMNEIIQTGIPLPDLLNEYSNLSAFMSKYSVDISEDVLSIIEELSELDLIVSQQFTRMQ
jgi:hypothetical protein